MDADTYVPRVGERAAQRWFHVVVYIRGTRVCSRAPNEIRFSRSADVPCLSVCLSQQHCACLVLRPRVGLAALDCIESFGRFNFPPTER